METILIIEDDSTMLRGLKDNFEFKGYRVLAAADGEEGLETALSSVGVLQYLYVKQKKADTDQFMKNDNGMSHGAGDVVKPD
jgi:DNA-binding response OmpR family regulator